MCGAFHSGIVLIAMCNLCLSCLHNSSWHLCLRGYKKTMSRFSLSLHCCGPHYVHSIHGSRWPLQEKCTKNSTWWFQSPSEPRRGFFWWAYICLTLLQPSNFHSDFHRAVPHMSIPAVGQVSTSLLHDHMAKSLANTHESIKTKT